MMNHLEEMRGKDLVEDVNNTTSGRIIKCEI